MEKKTNKVIYCSLQIAHRLIISTEGEAELIGATGLCQPQRPRQADTYSRAVKADLTLVNQKVLMWKKKKEKTPLVLKCNFSGMNGAFIGHLSLLPRSCLLFCMMFSTQQPESRRLVLMCLTEHFP